MNSLESHKLKRRTDSDWKGFHRISDRKGEAMLKNKMSSIIILSVCIFCKILLLKIKSTITDVNNLFFF